MIAGVISFLLANTIISWFGSKLFTGEVSKETLNISNKEWKTFLIFFIGYCIIFFIVYQTSK